ncbi:hypothetical protein RND81_06G113400 [Saponaria officinalis]|uniref:Trafficking protein particle complex subunit 13 n=1 Tax=Saponaria officinalis TaxID=3572 RepID=A0AAW1K5E8_SAPOF
MSGATAVGSGGGGASQGAHSLAFRVMRLCRPSLHVETPLLFHPEDLLLGEDLLYDLPTASDAAADAAEVSFKSRFLLSDPISAAGLSGLLVLPQSFGAIYLGETFCSYISINNSSSFEVRDIVIKAEIQTERQRVMLLDTSKSPVETIRAGGRYDFIVEHDVKELGAHTLVCTALYSDGEGDRKYLPQFFKFIVANPLSVRTKVRVVKDLTFLEACIENHTKSNLFMDQVEFQPAQHWSATLLTADMHPTQKKNISNTEYKQPVLIKSGGGIYNFLYQLKLSTQESTQLKVEGSNILGKLQITWRTNLGEPGRLQTQQILGSPVARKEIDLQVVKIPQAIILHKPFEVQLCLTNQTDRTLGPFEIWFSGDANGERAFMVNGLQTMTLPEIQAFSPIDLKMNLIAMKLGVQKITGITVFDSVEKKTYEPLPDLEIFVDVE